MEDRIRLTASGKRGLKLVLKGFGTLNSDVVSLVLHLCVYGALPE